MGVTELFKEEPVQWGLRGDPHLWKEIKEYFEEVEVVSSSAGFERKLIEAYEVITGHRLSERQHFVWSASSTEVCLAEQSVQSFGRM
jgi:hypothetical protein